MAITVEGLNPTVLPSRDHAVPAMKDGITVKLTVGQILDLLVDAAPGQLDTLNELAAALGDDPNFASTITAALALKASLSGTETLSNKTMAAPKIDMPSGEFMRSAFSGLKWSNGASGSGDLVNDFTLGAGWAFSDGAVPTMLNLASAMTKRTDAAWSAGNNGGAWLDGSAMPDGTGHIFLIGKSSDGTVDVAASGSLSPALPSGYDLKFRAFSCLREGGSLVQGVQLGSLFSRYISKLERDSSSPLSVTTITLGVPSGLPIRPLITSQLIIPPSSNVAISFGNGDSGAADFLMQTAFTGSSEVASDTTTISNIVTNVSRQVYVGVVVGSGSITTGRIRTLGWIDERR